MEIPTNRLLKVKRIVLKNGKKPVSDCVVWMNGAFAVVGTDETDTAPTWYNVDTIEKMEGVEVMEPRKARTVFL